MLEHPYINLATQHTIEDQLKSTGSPGPLGDPVIAATQFHKRIFPYITSPGRDPNSTFKIQLLVLVTFTPLGQQRHFS